MGATHVPYNVGLTLISTFSPRKSLGTSKQKKQKKRLKQAKKNGRKQKKRPKTAFFWKKNGQNRFSR
jgi:hypothetical protein